MSYRFHEQFIGKQEFNPLEVLKVCWEGDEASIRGVLSVVVRNPENAKYLYTLFALPLVWDAANVTRVHWNTRKDSPEMFRETIKRVRAHSQPPS